MTTTLERPTTETVVNETEKITNRAVLVRLTIGNWNERAVDKEITREINENKNASMDAGRYVKQLFPKEVTMQVRGLGNQARQTHNKMTMPWDDHGTRLLPINAYEKYVSLIDNIMEQRIDARNDLVNNYTAHIREAQRFRGELFCPEDYPEADELANSITMEREFMPVPDGQHFIAHLPEEERERIKQEIEERINERIRSAVEDLYRRLQHNVAQAAERMRPDEEGNEKTFRNTLIENLREISENAPMLNITNDPKIDQICKQIQDIVADLDPNQIRSKSKEYNSEKRQEFSKTMSDMETLLAGYVV